MLFLERLYVVFQLWCTDTTLVIAEHDMYLPFGSDFCGIVAISKLFISGPVSER